jgi:ribosomal protein S18 acetylase RimI-like enzyme
MTDAEPIRRTPWDCAALGYEAFELADTSAETMARVGAPGHYTAKVEPLSSKAALHRNGFYYCDTLIEPYCAAERLRLFPHDAAGFERCPSLESALAVCRSAFRHGRFHRDFNVEGRVADLRYENWLKTLHAADKVYGLVWKGEAAGFIAHEGGKLVLHAVAERHRGLGIARHLWTAVCADLVAQGQREISSSISAANVAALGLYATLGFRFRNPVDIYHRVIP